MKTAELIIKEINFAREVKAQELETKRLQREYYNLLKSSLFQGTIRLEDNPQSCQYKVRAVGV